LNQVSDSVDHFKECGGGIKYGSTGSNGSNGSVTSSFTYSYTAIMKIKYSRSESLMGSTIGRLAIITLLAIPLALANTLSLTIHLQHRFLPFPSPSSDTLPAWSLLGSAAIDSEVAMTKLESVSTSRHSESARDNGKGWYQVGVERGGEWVMASTRAVSTAAMILILSLNDGT
jgi:hypothetical protein